MSATLPLRDVHLPAAPGWWPPAPGWWLLVASILAALLLLVMIWSRRQRRCRQWQTLFDEGVAAAGTPAARIAAASELLRRAVRHCAPQSVHLQGEAWLRYLDGEKAHDFSEGVGRLLLDGGYRRDVEAAHAAQVCMLARARFIALMKVRW